MPTKPVTFVYLLLLLCMAAGLNLWFTDWGTDLEGAPILTIQLEPESPLTASESHGFGIYSPVSLVSTPWIPMSFGLFAPLICFGAMVYILVRLDPKATES